MKNWFKYQHYRDRHPPWIKLHRTFLTDPAVQSLSDQDQFCLIKLWLAASDNEGRVPDVRGMCGVSARHVLGICPTHRTDYLVSMLARFESKGLISHEDIRGTEPQIASKLLAQSRVEQSRANVHTQPDQPSTPEIRARKRLPFVKPMKQEVIEQMKAVGIPNPESEAEKFWDSYESKGWRVGRSPMVSWRGAVGTWKHNLGLFGGDGNGRRSAKIEKWYEPPDEKASAEHAEFVRGLGEKASKVDREWLQRYEELRKPAGDAEHRV